MLLLRNRIINKRINVRIEHVIPSRCREDFLNRVKENTRLKEEAKEKGVKLPVSYHNCDFSEDLRLLELPSYLIDC